MLLNPKFRGEVMRLLAHAWALLLQSAANICRFRAADDESFTGSLPGKSDLPILFTACDAGYFRSFAVPLIASWRHHSPGHPFHIHIYEPGPDDRAELDRLAARGNFTWSAGTSAAYAGRRRIFRYSADRFYTALRLLDCSTAGVLFMDTDSMIRSDISRGGLDPAADVSLYFHERFRNHPALSIKAGVIFFAATPGGRAYLRDVCSNLALRSKLPLFRHIDQRALFQAHIFHMARRRTVFRPLPFSMIDWEFGAGSTIWMAKGARKSDERFASAQIAEIGQEAA